MMCVHPLNVCLDYLISIISTLPFHSEFYYPDTLHPHMGGGDGPLLLTPGQVLFWAVVCILGDTFGICFVIGDPFGLCYVL